MFILADSACSVMYSTYPAAGWTPLMYASYVGHDTIVNLLLDLGVEPSRGTPTGLMPLMVAAGCGNESVCYFLMQVQVYYACMSISYIRTLRAIISELLFILSDRDNCWHPYTFFLVWLCLYWVTMDLINL